MRREDWVEIGSVSVVVAAGLFLSGCVESSAKTASGVTAPGGSAIDALAGSPRSKEQNFRISPAMAGMDRDDQLRLYQAYEQMPDNQAVTWANTSTGRYYTLVLRATMLNPLGLPCRQSELEAVSGGQRETAVKVACRRPDGIWEFAGQELSNNTAPAGTAAPATTGTPAPGGQGTASGEMPKDWGRQGPSQEVVGGNIGSMGGGWPNSGTLGNNIWPGNQGVGPGMIGSGGMGSGWPNSGTLGNNTWPAGQGTFPGAMGGNTGVTGGGMAQFRYAGWQ
ncbi:MAG: hypothetical protein H7836_11485 [Magnetococcus sp. YQC-3]